MECMAVVVASVVVACSVGVVDIVAAASRLLFEALRRNAARVRSTRAVPVVRACIIMVIVRV